MSKTLTVKLKDEIYSQAEKLRPKAKLNRNAYINEAVRRLNAAFARQDLADQFRMESQMVRDPSMEVLSDFETLHDPVVE